MPSTYSINPGTNIEAFKLINLNASLSELPDNTANLIYPHDLRDAIYTTWENIVIKPTKGTAGIEYIGIDRADLYEKIFLGKKQIAGSEVLNDKLLNSDVDVFFYNTKTASSLTNQNLKIGFLAGASTSVFYYGASLSIPTIEVKSISTAGGNVLDFNIINNSYAISGLTHYGGNISIGATFGNIMLNGLILPTAAENLSANDGYILRKKNIGGYPYLLWTASTVTVTDINTAGPFNITANPLFINGANYNYTNLAPSNFGVGGIGTGSTFSNISAIEILEKIFYSYVKPAVTINTAPYVEIMNIGQTVSLNYTIIKYLDTYTVSSITTIPSPILNNTETYLKNYLNTGGYQLFIGSGSYSIASQSQTFTLSVVDTAGNISSAHCSVEPLYPIFYGTSATYSATQSTVQGLLSGFSKTISITPNLTVPMSGDGVCLYYLVPKIYNTSGSMSALYDQNNSPSYNEKSVFRGNGTPFTMSLNSPSTGYWTGIDYNCYIYSPSGTPAKTTIGVPTIYAANYQFVF